MSYRRPSGHRYRPFDSVPSHIRCQRCRRRVKMHGHEICAECDRAIKAWARRVNREDAARRAAEQASS